MNIEELKRLAEAALWTGRWYDGGCETLMGTYGDDSESCEGHGEIAHPVPLGIVPYLVEAQPAAILELIRQRDELLAALKRIKANLMHQRLCGQSAGLLHAAIQAEGDAEEVIAKMEG